MERNIFKAYDVRGIYGTQITEPIARKIGHAGARMLGAGVFILARDAREGSKELSQAVAEGFTEECAALGIPSTIVDIGLSTTPMFYFTVNDCNASGGAIITASHNPPEYNGIKMVRAAAIPISGTDIEKVYKELKP